MDSNQLLILWRTLHSCNAIMDWITLPLGVIALVLIFIRVRARFLLLFIAANIVELFSRVLDPMFPPSPVRPYTIGVMVDGMWMLSSVCTIVATLLCVKWFRTEQTQAHKEIPTLLENKMTN
jgi:uncharacterized BrkB/YihY/UPF0761 family membrane protein